MTPLDSFRRHRRLVLVIGATCFILWLPVWWFGNDLLRRFESSAPSVAHGSSGSGSLEHGKRLPSSGPNFRTYSRLGSLFGRTAVHSTVEAILLASYARMAVEHPEVRFIYGETGHPEGGPFPPHRSHQNGTSVDLFVPVVDAAGHSTTLPVGPTNEFGYWIEFDSVGQWHDYTVDFPVVAAHLLALQEIARARGAPVARVIFAPEFHAQLAKSPEGRQALASIPWMVAKPWVRHDEHYHVDFAVPGAVPAKP